MCCVQTGQGDVRSVGRLTGKYLSPGLLAMPLVWGLLSLASGSVMEVKGKQAWLGGRILASKGLKGKQGH